MNELNTETITCLEDIATILQCLLCGFKSAFSIAAQIINSYSVPRHRSFPATPHYPCRQAQSYHNLNNKKNLPINVLYL